MSGDAPGADPGSERFGAALAAFEAALDWGALGAGYCSGDAATFFDEERVDGLLERGFELADALGARLARGGRSVYVGAAVAELVPILFESLVLGRAVDWRNLPTAETAELARVGAAVGRRFGVALPLPRAAPAPAAGTDARGRGWDHVWCVSVLTDPDHFPALHDALYERSGAAAVGGGDLAAEQRRARALLDDVLGGLEPGGLLTTSEEEWPLARRRARALGRELSAPEPGPLTALVGDRVVWSRVGPSAGNRAP